jgi:hypothetical protein
MSTAGLALKVLPFGKSYPAFFLTPHDRYHRIALLEETGPATGGMDAQ